MAALSGLEQFFTKGTGEFDEEGVELREFAMPGADDMTTAKRFYLLLVLHNLVTWLLKIFNQSICHRISKL